MPILRLAIDATGARQGATEFSRQAEVVKTAARGVDATLNRMFSALLVGGAVYQSVKTLKDFDYAMQQIAGVTRASEVELKQFRDAARDLGATTVFSATESAEALLTLSKAGFDATTSLESIPEVLALAQANSLDLAFAAETVVKTMGQFGLSAADAERITDSLNETAIETVTDVRELGQALKFVGTQSATLGISLEETNAALGVLVGRGIQGAMAGTNLRGVLKALIDPSKEARATLHGMGLTLEELNPRTHDLVDIFKRLREAGLDTGEAIRIFNQRNATAALALSQNTEEYERLITAQNGAAGSTKDLAQTIGDSLSGSWDRFKNSIESITLSVGDSGLVAALRGALDFSRGFALSLAGMNVQLDGIAVAGHEAAEVLKAISFGVAAGGAVQLAKALLVGVVPAIHATIAALKTLQVAMLSNPFTAIAAGIGLAVGALYYFRDSMIEIGGTSARLRDWIGAAWDVTVELTLTAWEIVVESVSSAWDAITAQVEYGWEMLKAIFSSGLETISGWLNSWGIVTFFSTAWDTIKDLSKDFANFLVAVVVGAIDTIDDLMTRFTSALTSMFMLDFSSFDAFKNSFGNFMTKVAEASDISQLGSDLASNFWDAYQTDWVDLGGKAIDETVTWMRAEFDSVAQSVADEIGVTVDAATAAFNVAFDKLAARAKERYNASLQPQGFVGPPFLAAQAGFDIGDETDAMDSQTAAMERYQKQLDRLIQSYRLEAETIGFTSNEIEKLTALREAEQIMKEAGIEVDQKYLDQLRQEVEIVQQLRAGQYFKDAIKDLRDEREFMMLSNDEREKAIALRAAERQAIEAGLTSYADDLERLRKEIDLNQKLSRLKDLADGVGQSFADAFTDAITGAKSFEEAVNSLANAVFRLIVQQTVAQPIASAVSGAFSGAFSGLFAPAAKGAVFSQGIQPFGSGGEFVSSPTIRPMAGGGSALIGEAGPEVVLPIKRTSDGKMGVVGAGGSGGRPISVNVNITARDVDSFRRSKNQVAATLGRAIQTATSSI